VLGPKQIIVIALTTLLVGFAAGCATNGWRLGQEIQALKLKHAQEQLDAAENAAKRQSDMEAAKNEVIEQSQAEATKLAADAARAKSERDRLRRDLQASRDALSNATCASTTAHAQTLNELFAECVERYSEVAGKADAHALDASRLFDSWKAVKEAE
jgi:uncharacterized membrane protein